MYSSEKKVESLNKDKIKFYVLFCYSAAQTNSYKTVLKILDCNNKERNTDNFFFFSLSLICDIMYFQMSNEKSQICTYKRDFTVAFCTTFAHYKFD